MMCLWQKRKVKGEGIMIYHSILLRYWFLFIAPAKKFAGEICFLRKQIKGNPMFLYITHMILFFLFFFTFARE